MPKNPYAVPYDLITPDGKITKVSNESPDHKTVTVLIESIHPNFVGFCIDQQYVTFNMKSTLAQLGVNCSLISVELSVKHQTALVHLTMFSFGDAGKKLLSLLVPGLYIGKLFAKDPRRLIRSSDYINRLFGKSDHLNNPLLILSEEYKNEEIIDDSEKHRLLVKIPLRTGVYRYDSFIEGLLPTVIKGLNENRRSFRKFLYLHQQHLEEERVLQKEEILLVKTMKMNIRTLFSRVAHDALPKGFEHASADILEPGIITGDIFEFHPKDKDNMSQEEISHIPLEFYSLEPYREFFAFSDKDALRDSLKDMDIVFKALETAPKEASPSVFVVKNYQLNELQSKDWILSDPQLDTPLPLFPKTREEKKVIQEHITRQSQYPIVKSMQEGFITSEGILLSTYFPSNILAPFLLNEHVAHCLKGIYFLYPSKNHGSYFSHDDRALLRNLTKQNIDIFWADKKTNLLLKYTPRKDIDTGLFVPIDKVQMYLKASIFGVYGSRFEICCFEEKLRNLFLGLIEMKDRVNHDLFHKDKTIALATGGGPGVMSMGNKIASELGILSIGHAVDFRKPHENEENIEVMNHYIQARMTYRLEQVIIRQSEFGLDFPIFFEGGIGTDFEYALEILRTQVGTKTPTPIILFGSKKYWSQKLTSNFKANVEKGTISGSEWISNCLYCVQDEHQALTIYYKFFTGNLEIGRDHKGSPDGFMS